MALFEKQATQPNPTVSNLVYIYAGSAHCLFRFVLLRIASDLLSPPFFSLLPISTCSSNLESQRRRVFLLPTTLTMSIVFGITTQVKDR